MSKKVSVIIPVYNVEKYLNTCVQSVVRQSYNNLEIIIIDDGATDASPQICDNWGNADERVNVYHYENGGLSAARNRGLKKATGDYIVFLDSDDYYLTNDAIKEMVHAIEKENADIVVFNWKNVLEDGTAPQSIQHDNILGVLFPPNGVVNGEMSLDYLFSRRIESYAPMRMAKHEFYKKINFGFPENRVFEDVATTYRVLGECERVAFLNKKIYGYLQRNGSILKSHNSNYFFDWIKALDEMLDYMNSRYDRLHLQTIRYIYNAWLNMYYYSYKFSINASKGETEEIHNEIKNRLDAYNEYVSCKSFAREKDKIKYLLYKTKLVKFL